MQLEIERAVRCDKLPNWLRFGSSRWPAGQNRRFRLSHVVVLVGINFFLSLELSRVQGVCETFVFLDFNAQFSESSLKGKIAQFF